MFHAQRRRLIVVHRTSALLTSDHEPPSSACRLNGRVVCADVVVLEHSECRRLWIGSRAKATAGNQRISPSIHVRPS